MQASMILVRTEAEANDVIAKLNAGNDFVALAKEFSIDAVTAPKGGDLGEFYPGDWSPEIEGAIAGLKVNQVSKPVKTKVGFHVFKRTK